MGVSSTFLLSLISNPTTSSRAAEKSFPYGNKKNRIEYILFTYVVSMYIHTLSRDLFFSSIMLELSVRWYSVVYILDVYVKCLPRLCHGYSIQGLESKVEGSLTKTIQSERRLRGYLCTFSALARIGLSVLNISMRIPRAKACGRTTCVSVVTRSVSL